MNYLAHMYLSKITPEAMLGNFLGDFVKGDAAGRFPREVVEGIMHHRNVDHYTDTNAVVSSSKKLISPSRRRFSGIIIDIAYDHFLSRNWERYSAIDLSEFIGTIYKNLGNRTVVVPQRAEWVIERMIQEDWLSSYGTLEGIDKTFKRISKRLKKENTLCSAVEELETHYHSLNAHFSQFFPQAIRSQRRDA